MAFNVQAGPVPLELCALWFAWWEIECMGSVTLESCALWFKTDMMPLPALVCGAIMT